MSLDIPHRKQLDSFGADKFLDHHINNAEMCIQNNKYLLKNIGYNQDAVQAIKKQCKRIMLAIEVYEGANK